jgi:hypothetical protein
VRPVGRAVVVLLAVVITTLTCLLLAGHGPWAGRTILALGNSHGLNTGDLPVLLAWAVGIVGCGYLLLARDQ